MNAYRSRQGSFAGGFLDSAVGLLVAWNVIFYLIQLVLGTEAGRNLIGLHTGGRDPMVHWLALYPPWVLARGEVWRLVSYMFLHGSFTHLLFNMYGLWIFGQHVEAVWGSAKFTRYYFVTGVGAGLCTFVFPHSVTVGASGAVYGVLLAFASLFPQARVGLFFLFPASARTAVLIFAGIEMFSQVVGVRDGIAHLAHLGGLGAGWLYLRATRRRRPPSWS